MTFEEKFIEVFWLDPHSVLPKSKKEIWHYLRIYNEIPYKELKNWFWIYRLRNPRYIIEAFLIDNNTKRKVFLDSRMIWKKWSSNSHIVWYIECSNLSDPFKSFWDDLKRWLEATKLFKWIIANKWLSKEP